MELVGDTLEGFRSFVVWFMILMSRVRVFISAISGSHTVCHQELVGQFVHVLTGQANSLLIPTSLSLVVCMHTLIHPALRQFMSTTLYISENNTPSNPTLGLKVGQTLFYACEALQTREGWDKSLGANAGRLLCLCGL